MADSLRNSYPDKDNGRVRNLSLTGNAGSGKLPPQALDMEEAVLGALMVEKDALHRVMDILQPHMFYKDANTFIFEAILELFQN
ncbi:MAG: replicative DNA helicase, partial [Bacteroidetes bacterium]